MGLYDTVHFECPKCHSDIQVQSKADKCLLVSYPEEDVPMSIAADINNEMVWCQNEDCGESWRVAALTSLRGIPMTLTKTPKPHDDHEEELEGE